MPCWAFCLVSLQKIAIFLTVMAAHSEDMHLFLSRGHKQIPWLCRFFQAIIYFFLLFLQFRNIARNDINRDILFSGLSGRLLVQSQQFTAELQTVAHLAHLVKHTMGPVWNIDRYLCSAQLSEGFGIQDEQESTFLLETEAEEIKYVM